MPRNNTMQLTYLDRPSSSPATPAQLLILLHGYGSNERDLYQIGPYVSDRHRIISVRAPLVLEREMYAWFPLAFTPEGIRVDREEAARARVLLCDFLREITRTHLPEGGKPWLMGFSQGAVMSYLAALNEPGLVSGVIALSGQLPDNAEELNLQHDHFRKLPFLVMHGTYDDVLPVGNGTQAREWLSGNIEDITYHQYGMGHEIIPEQLDQIREWLARKS
ncbi:MULTISPECIES: alpha/beta hydrolase [Prosthecochloris]|uniref:Phospholipase n=1 Tax=Prosthecochloris vibrioformis TaxID=1098 RepID=A0A5C4S3M8_PROVB|nr:MULTISPECIES: phospholipase [Prosthecochloris]ANT65709.1 Carboxylesterase 2 [Prosthecochloris sp. CIB 2401]TNJ37915.1 phospholipase [Prosthecochloris vibrioformis]